MAIAQGWSAGQKQAKEVQSQERQKNYLNRIAKGEEIKPDEQDYDYSDHLTAQTKVMGAKAANADADLKVRQQKQAQLDDLIASGEQSYQAGDKQKFWDAMSKTYEFMPDGHKVAGFSSDYSQMVIELPDGQRSVKETPDPKQALQMAKGFSKKFQAIDEQFKTWRRQKNTEFLANPDIWVDSTGNPALHYSIIGENGELVEVLKDPRTGEHLGGFDPDTKQFVKPKSDYVPWQAVQAKQKIEDRPGEKEKAQAELSGIKARTEATVQSTNIEKTKAQAATEKNQGTAKSTKAEQEKYKSDLELMLKPFAGSKAVYDDMGNLTDEGKTALDAAQRLAGKYRRKEKMDPDEKDKVQTALRAEAMFKQISDDIYGRYRKDTGASWKDVK